MKTYVLTLSLNFPAKHPRNGEPTNFCSQLLNAVWDAHNMSIGFQQFGMKLHTIRANYDLWYKRFILIDAGRAILSVRYWTGIPYRSKQMELCKLSKKDGIGLQKLYLTDGINLLGKYGIVESTRELFGVRVDSKIGCNILAHNEGLSYEDWDDWFKKYDKNAPLAIIHFTSFRY